MIKSSQIRYVKKTFIIHPIENKEIEELNAKIIQGLQ